MSTSSSSLNFALSFPTGESKRHKWGCVATSLNPVPRSAKFKTKPIGGEATTKNVVFEDTSDIVMMKSFLTILVLMIPIYLY